jgi:TolB-like protein
MILSPGFLNKLIQMQQIFLPRTPPSPSRGEGEEGGGNLFNAFILASLLILGLLFSPNVARTGEIKKENSATGEERIRVAVFPVENLSGTLAPVKEIRQMFIEELSYTGADVVDEETLEKFMAKYRIRYTGGISTEISKAFKQDIHVSGVLITSLELYSDANPPKISLISRLVSTGENPSILWIDTVGMAGDQSRGLLDLGLIEDPGVLLDKAMRVMFDSMDQYLSRRSEGETGYNAKKEFRPQIAYRSPSFDPNRKYTVAIAPFFNYSLRKYAGDLMVLHFARELKRFDRFDVVEMGVVRQAFLEMRVILDQGVSLINAESIAGLVNADLILGGDVVDYEDYQGVWGTPKVGFAAQFIDRKSREVVWSSSSYNQGDENVFFFDVGRFYTASVMVSEMAQWVGRMMLQDNRNVQGTKGSSGPVK